MKPFAHAEATIMRVGLHFSARTAAQWVFGSARAAWPPTAPAPVSSAAVPWGGRAHFYLDVQLPYSTCYVLDLACLLGLRADERPFRTCLRRPGATSGRA